MTKRMPSIKEVIDNQSSGEPSEKELHNQFVEAILLGWKGIKYDPANPPDLEPDVWGYLHRAAKWWRGKDEGASVEAPYGANPDLIVRFYRWFARTYESAAPPTKRETIAELWVSFRLDASPKSAPAQTAQVTPGFEKYAVRPATSEELAEYEAGLQRIAAGAEKKREWERLHRKGLTNAQIEAYFEQKENVSNE